jgi:hypothetical protein
VNFKSLSVISFFCLLLMILGSLAGSAQQVQPLEPEWLRQMYAQGWEKVEEGVLRRDAGEGKYETFSYGAEGLQRVIEGYEQQLSFLQDRYNEAPSEELIEVMEKLQGEIDKLSENLGGVPSAEAVDGSALEECTQMAFGGDSFAGPLQSSQGITATATAYFHNACGIVGVADSVTYADATNPATGLHDTHNQADSDQGTWIDNNSATANALGSAGCSSWAQASVSINGDMVFQTPLAESSNCSLPLQVTISGPASMTTDYYGTTCANVTWTANASQGNPGYTYQWYIYIAFPGSPSTGTATAVQGATGTTLTKSYCNVSTSETVKVVVTDAQGAQATNTFTTNIQYTGPLSASVSGPESAATNSSTPCVNVTWTASAGGAHPGYTYNWYLGTGTTVLGTGSTFTQQYCNTSTSATAKVIVTDSDGHTVNATKTTTITHTSNPLTASISGPLRSRLTTQCVNVTWTANVTGGAPGYTYSWYLGTSTTVQGTGSTLTKTYCSPQTVDVKLIARDSAAATAEATFKTSIVEYDPVCKTCTQ